MIVVTSVRRKDIWKGLPVFRHARTIESFKGNVSLKADKLVIDGRTYTVDTLNKLPPSLNPFTYSARQNETVLVFHGTSSPLANSYPCAFKENGITFNNVEQYMYYHKALTAGDDIAATRMLGIKHVTEQRRLNKSVNTVPQWAGYRERRWRTETISKLARMKCLLDFLRELEIWSWARRIITIKCMVLEFASLTHRLWTISHGQETIFWVKF